MSRSFFLNESVDPRDLAINLRFKGKPIIHPRVREAQQELVLLIKQAINAEPDYQPCDRCHVSITYSFPTRSNDIDGPVKRTIDAIEQAHKALGYRWNDNRIVSLGVNKTKGVPGIIIWMYPRREEP